jgi:signal peptidase II
VKRASFFILALVVITIDQATKMLALALLTPFESQPFIGDVLRFYLVRNDSAAFSIGNGQTWIFTILSTLAALAVIWVAPRLETGSWRVIGGVFLGGIVGNLIDRITREPGFPNGQVIDFLQLPLNFPVFNVADMAIVFAMSATIIRILRGHRIGK